MNLSASLRRAAVAVAFVTVTVPLTGCGGGGNLSSWVGTFCGAGSDLRGSLSRSNDQLREVLSAHPGMTEVQVRLLKPQGTLVARLPRHRVTPSGPLMADLKALLGPFWVAFEVA